MAKDKSTKKEAKPVVANGVKSGRVTKPESKSVKSKTKVEPKVLEKEAKKSKKSKKEPTPEPESEDEATSDSSASSDSESDSESEAETKPVAKTNGAKKAAESSDEEDSEDDSSDEEDTKDVTMADSSDDDSDDSDESSEDEKPAPKAGKKAVEADSDDAEEDSEDDSEEDSDEEMEEKAEPAKKRKAEGGPDLSAKRFKANGEECNAPSKNLFVGSLSWNVDEDWLAREFEGFGEITGVRIMTRPEDGKSKGFGFVEFADVESATAALDAKQNAEVDGRNLNIDFSTPRPDRSYNNEQVGARAQKFGDKGSGNPPSNTLFVGNLSFSATQEIVGETFQEYGTVNGVRLPTDRDSGELKGYAYVEFGSIEEAQAAHEALNGADIAGRNIRTDFAGPRPDNNGAGGGGRGGRGGRGGFNDRGRGGRGGGRGGRGGRGGFNDRGRGRGGFSSTNRGGFGDFQGKKVTF